MYPHAAPSFAAMTLAPRYAAVTSKGLFICAGRTCGFAAEIIYGRYRSEAWRATEST